MSQESDKIKIKTATTNPPGTDGDNLKNCYFLPTNYTGKYILFDSTGTPLVTSIMPIPGTLPTGTSFTFQLGPYTWWIPNPLAGSEAFSITGTGSSAAVTGSWYNNDTSGHVLRADNDPSVGGDPTGESGTFQGQAGQVVDAEAEDAASAAKA